MKNKNLFIGGALVALIALYFIGSRLYTDKEAQRLGFLAQDNAETFIRDYAPTMGSDDAKVFLVEFFDPECESCRAFYPNVKRILKDYDGKVKLVLRYAPFHGNSKFAIKILESARLQGKYWQTLELLYRYQPMWGSHHNPRPELIWEFLPELDLDIDRLKEDMKSPQITHIIEQDSLDAKTLRVRGTPSFFINGKMLKHFGDAPLRAAIDAELQRDP